MSFLRTKKINIDSLIEWGIKKWFFKFLSEDLENLDQQKQKKTNSDAKSTIIYAQNNIRK